MVRRKRNNSRGSSSKDGQPRDIYGDMLAEVDASAFTQSSPERPLKRPRRRGERRATASAQRPQQISEYKDVTSNKFAAEIEDEDEDIEFEDVELPNPTLQTMYRDSEDEDEDDEDIDAIQFEDVDFDAIMNSNAEEKPKELELNLTAQQATSTPRRNTNARRPISKEEKAARIDVHKLHLLCLLSHCSRRNRWCNDSEVQSSLRPLLPEKTVRYLIPGTNLSQFGRTESLKNGLQQASTSFKVRFDVTERGLRRSLWAEDPSHLAKVSFNIYFYLFMPVLTSPFPVRASW
jgi:xeroderma pigmentosum group C-complementing protein